MLGYLTGEPHNLDETGEKEYCVGHGFESGWGGQGTREADRESIHELQSSVCEQGLMGLSIFSGSGRPCVKKTSVWINQKLALEKHLKPPSSASELEPNPEAVTSMKEWPIVWQCDTYCHTLLS